MDDSNGRDLIALFRSMNLMENLIAYVNLILKRTVQYSQSHRLFVYAKFSASQMFSLEWTSVLTNLGESK